MKIYFDNVTHSSKYSNQDENSIRNLSLTLLRLKCQAPGLRRVEYRLIDTLQQNIETGIEGS